MNVTGRERRRIIASAIKYAREAIAAGREANEVLDYVLEKLKPEFDIDTIKQLIELIIEVIMLIIELFGK